MQRDFGRKAMACSLAIAWLMSACGGDDGADSATTTTEPGTSTAGDAPADEGSDIAATIMVISDFDAGAGFSSPDALPAVQGALEAFPNVEVLSCDSQQDANAGNECQREAVDAAVDAVIVGFSPLSSDHAILTEAGIPVVGNGDPAAPNTFGVASTLGAYSGLGVGAAEAGCENTGILYLDGTDFLADALRTGLEIGDSQESARAPVPANAPDLAPAIARLLDADSDCILLSVLPNMIVQAVTAIDQSGESPTIAAVGAVFTADVVESLGDLADGVLTTEIQVNPADTTDPVVDEIADDVAAFDEDVEVGTIGVHAWASAKVLAAGLLQHQGEVTPQSLTTTLNGLRDVDVHGAIHPFSSVEIASDAYARFFNHWGLNYVIEDGVPVRQGDFYDLGPILEAQ